MNAPSGALKAQIQAAKAQSIDSLTVVCIAIISYLLAAIVHEGLGHGLAAAVLGAEDIRVSAAAVHFDAKSISPAASRIIAIAGPLVGLIVGFLLALYQAHTQSRNAEFRYCLYIVPGPVVNCFPCHRC